LTKDPLGPPTAHDEIHGTDSVSPFTARPSAVTIPRMNRRNTRAPVPLDDVSKAIIEQLQQDGRRSYAAIGKVVGLSEAAVRQRVQRLIEGGVMQVVAVTDPLEPVADKIAELEEVDYVVVTAGTYDLLVEVVAESDEHLLELISDRIRAIEGVAATETFMYLRLRKQTYSWGVR
jgi:Lrp/AsnC family transcriptional regulator, regulator for asnA, asnC and gidA